MKARLLVGAVAAGLMALGTSAHAAPIAAGSVLSLSGRDSYTATSLAFTNPENIGAGSGSFAILAPLPCNGCATMIASLTAATPLGSSLYTGHNEANTITTDLLLTSVPVFSFSDGALPNLTVMGNGTLDLTGFDPTPGSYILTTQGPTGTEVTFSVTSIALAAAPEPASLAILGGALAAMGGLARRRRKAAQR
jgi:hypothetical protein